ncbi:hypothetical protein AK812_SmicGene544 [Symbiodinium microadriaticum]|uniref:Uncharacterized protein n=1 Tax=Symbiodinium microadriaticum TaxID=2951 RepID=A0A1Q9F6C4_SYMMI|nr:hypothetical protein AK812_SmicGene544 [Symbiodinium microadriaticum]
MRWLDEAEPAQGPASSARPPCITSACEVQRPEPKIRACVSPSVGSREKQKYSDEGIETLSRLARANGSRVSFKDVLYCSEASDFADGGTNLGVVDAAAFMQSSSDVMTSWNDSEKA